MYSRLDSFLTQNEQQSPIELAVDLTNQLGVMNPHPEVVGQHHLPQASLAQCQRNQSPIASVPLNTQVAIFGLKDCPSQKNQRTTGQMGN